MSSFLKGKATKEHNCPLLNATLAILDNSAVPSFQYFLLFTIIIQYFRGHAGGSYFVFLVTYELNCVFQGRSEEDVRETGEE